MLTPHSCSTAATVPPLLPLLPLPPLLPLLVLQARKDYFFIALPNAMGVAFNTLSLLLCAIFPARARQQATAEEGKVEGSSDGATSEPGALQRLLRSFGGNVSAMQQLPKVDQQGPAL